MSADIEVRKWGSSLAAAFAVDEEGLARNEARLKRKRLAFEVTVGNGVIEVLDPPEAGRDFGVHDRVDHQSTAVPGLGEGVPGPLRPGGVLGQDVEQDTGVHQGGGPP